MRVLPTSVHGAIDYAWGALLLASPFLFGFAGHAASFWTAVLFGLGAIAYSLVTDYELGIVELIPVRVHLALDAVAGLALALTPLVLGLDPAARLPFVLFGLFSLGASLVTRTRTAREISEGRSGAARR